MCGPASCILNEYDLIFAEKAPTTKQGLINAIKRAARKVKKEHIQHMVDSMPRRIEQCIAHEGGRTKY